MNFKPYILTLALTVASAANGHTAVELTLDQCVELALENNPELRTAILEVEKAKDMKGTAFDAPMTAVTLKQDATDGGGLDNGVSFTQEFEFPTVYVARYKSLRAEADLREAEARQSRAATVQAVTDAYCRLLFFESKCAILARQDSIYDEFVHIAAARFDNGESSRLEKLNAVKLFNDNRMTLYQAQSDLLDCRLELQRLTGVDLDITPALATNTRLELPPTETELDYYSTTDGIIDLRKIELSDRNASLAAHEFAPSIALGATVQALIKSFNPYNVDRQRFDRGNFMGFEVGISVPLFFGAQRARWKAAGRSAEIARLDAETRRSAMSSEYSSLINRHKIQSDELNYFERQGIRDAEEINRLARVSYRLGEIGYAEYVQNLETAAAIRMSYAESLLNYNITISRLNYFLSK